MRLSFNFFSLKYPLPTVLLLALVPRLVAAIFSKGYGMHDDHFLVIEAAQSWLDGFDYNRWLPWNQSQPAPTGHSWFYVGIHYCMFWLLEKMGMTDPQAKMYVVRFVHALYSLLTVVLVYRIVHLYSDSRRALQAGLIVALLWFFPILAVRNLTEMVSVPPLLAAAWFLCRGPGRKWALWGGFFLALAVAIRFQNVFMVAGFGLFLLIRRQWIDAIWLSLAFGVTLFLTQIADLWLWGRPFAELQEYVMYNLANKETYFSAPWYQYILTVAGLLLPPLGVLWFFAWLRYGYKWLLLYLPSLVFFTFHSYFPNKQERFIIPVFPFVIMIGVLAWQQLKYVKLKRISLGIFWIINILLLCSVSWSYTKRSRVEAMYMLKAQTDYRGLLVENTTDYEEILLPRFYAANWSGMYYLSKASDVDKEGALMLDRPDELWPTHAFFFDRTQLEQRVEGVQKQYQIYLEPLGVAEPSFLDYVLFKLNPVNRNEEIFVFKIIRSR
jgi:hypothetical protein